MRKNSKNTSNSKSKAFSRLNLFGPPPLLYGEDEAAYYEMVARVSAAWGRGISSRRFGFAISSMQLWNISRWRRIQAAFLADKVWNDVNKQASSLAAEPTRNSWREQKGKRRNGEIS